jgi:ATP-dependent Clp protease, protease subunit
MITVAISGTIGYDVTGKSIREALDKAKGQDIEIQVSSPGGLVTEGLEIYNLIKNYKGKKTTRLMGLAASMASYIVLAGDKVIAEDNAIYMVHNPWGFAMGDYRDMKKTADVLSGFAGVLAKAYARKSGKELSDIRGLMDEETYLYGDEILAAGFADEIEPAGDGPEDKEEARAIATAQIDACKKKLKEAGSSGEDAEKIAAMLGELPGELADMSAGDIKIEKSGVAGKKTAAKADKKEGPKMDIKALKSDHADLYAEVMAVGVREERERVKALRGWSDADSENARVKEIVREAEASGKTADEVMPQLLVALREAPKKDGDNPPDVATKKQDSAGGAGDVTALTDEEKLLIERLGVTEEAYLAEVKKAEKEGK